MKKAFLIFSMIFGSAMATAKPLGVALWDPTPGKAPQMILRPGGRIHRSRGLRWPCTLTLVGSITWSPLRIGMAGPDSMRPFRQACLAPVRAGPLPIPRLSRWKTISWRRWYPEAPGRFTQIYLWEPLNGNVMGLRDARQAREIHEAAGIDIGINVDQMNACTT